MTLHTSISHIHTIVGVYFRFLKTECVQNTGSNYPLPEDVSIGFGGSTSACSDFLNDWDIMVSRDCYSE